MAEHLSYRKTLGSGGDSWGGEGTEIERTFVFVCLAVFILLVSSIVLGERASDTFPTDPQGHSRRDDWMDVKTFGAKADGIAKDRAAIAAAVAAMLDVNIIYLSGQKNGASFNVMFFEAVLLTGLKVLFFISCKVSGSDFISMRVYTK